MRLRSLFLTFGTLMLLSSCQKEGPIIIDNLEDLLDGIIIYYHNPNDIAPLSGEVTFNTKVQCRATIEVGESDPVTYSITQDGGKFQIPILGLYPDTKNQIVLSLEADDKVFQDTHYIQTPPLPAGFPEIETIANPTQMEPGMHLAELGLANNGTFLSYPIIFDNDGNVRWYLDLSHLEDLCYPFKRLKNGNIATTRSNHLYEYDMVGNLINDYSVEGYTFHHEFLELPNGNFIIAVNKDDVEFYNGEQWVNSVEDHIIEIDRNSRAIVREWDFRQILDVDRFDLVDGAWGDWFHMNAIFHDESDNTLIVSGRNQGLVKVSMENELVWILAPHQNWGNAGPEGNGPATAPYLLTAVDGGGAPYDNAIQQGTAEDANFAWVWGQHAPLLLPNGNLFVFDNGFNRAFGTGDPYSRGVEYEIDEGAKTVRQVWEYGKDRGAEFQSIIISDVDYLPNTTNRLITPGTINYDGQHYAKIAEVTYPGKQVVFEATIYFKDVNSNGEFGWGQFDLVYRSERMSLYP